MSMYCEFAWSDGWYIEDGKAWFVYGQFNVLSCFDFVSGQCEYIIKIPDLSHDRFRLNPRCIKINHDIFCMPDMANDIWIYHLDRLDFSQIKIKNPDRKRISVTNFWIYENKLFALSVGLNKIIEIDIEKKVINNYYTICNDKEILRQSVKIGSDIYCISSVSNYIYQFNLETKRTNLHILSHVKDNLCTISYDGSKFWLSGYKKKVYIWDKENNSIQIIDRFPIQFGVYEIERSGTVCLDYKGTVSSEPLFYQLIPLDNCVWIIPYMANKILYVDKSTYDIQIFEMENEDERKDSFNRTLSHKYLTEYIIDNRYIGIFSLKNNCLLEIDSVNKEVKKKIFSLNEYGMREMVKLYNKKVYFENNSTDKIIYKMDLLASTENKYKKAERNIGEIIYKL